MTKALFFAAAALPLAMLAQIRPGGSSFQQEGWIRPAGGLVTLGPPKLEGQTGPVLGRPLSANEVRTTVQTLSDGSHVNRSETNYFYRDSEGRMRVETSTDVLIFDGIGGHTYEMTPRNKTYRKYPASNKGTVTIAAAAHHTSIDSSYHSGSSKTQINENKKTDEGVTEDLPLQSINGVWARGSRVTITIPAGTFGNDRDLKVVNERWFSDDLKLLVKSSNCDPRFGVTTYELTNIVQAQPDPALFQPPADYTEGRR
jgi:hypothetical protein